MPRKDKVIHISNLPSTFRGNVTRNGRFIQNGIPPLGGAYDKVAKSTGLIRLGNEFLYNGINNLVSKDNREKLMNNTAGRLINYVKDFNKESLPSDDELGPTFPFNIIQTPRSNGGNLPQKQYAVGGKVPNVVAGGIAQPLGNNFFYMNGRKHSQGGIDIGPSDKTGIEVEGGEVVETNGNELKVYSAQPILNGASPAQLVMGGANPNKVFKAQEDFKDRNGINDDGTKYKEGGKIYQAPDEYKRQIAESGSIIIGGYPTIAGNRNYKFIIYMDDLSFEEFEIEYKFLKAVIEGGVETKPDNILIYATSNRRHLIKENWSDRNDIESDNGMHRSDTLEEKLSLVKRFGVTINYSKPSQKEYFGIVIGLARKVGIKMSDDELCKEANKWELSHGGISGRTAQQFINYISGLEE